MTRHAVLAGVLAGVLASLALLGCDKADADKVYQCLGKGHVLRYRDGIKLPAADEEGLQVVLTSPGDKSTLGIAPNAKIAAHQNPAMRLDKARSTEAELVYLFDQTDPASRFRTVTSVVLNQISGEFRLFHHWWIPPAQWRDSDQYFFSGNCSIGKR